MANNVKIHFRHVNQHNNAKIVWMGIIQPAKFKISYFLTHLVYNIVPNLPKGLYVEEPACHNIIKISHFIIIIIRRRDEY